MKSFCLFVSLIISTACLAQKSKIMDLPAPFHNPSVSNLLAHQGGMEFADIAGGDDAYLRVAMKSMNAKKGTPFVVFVDRSNVSFYWDKKKKTTVAERKLQLGEAYYVLDEYGDMVEIGSFERNQSVSVGWVEKKYLIFWTTPLVDNYSNIEIKAFIVNTADEDLREQIMQDASASSIYKIYDRPDANYVADQPRDEGTIYNVLFVYKYDPVNKSYLVSKKPYLNGQSPGQLMGWVAEHRIVEWKTALALEPNFTEAAFKERANDPMKQASVWQDPRDVKSMISSGVYSPTLIKPDPCLDRYMAVRKANRFKGMMPRHPLYSNENGMLSCGTIGKTTAGNAEIVPGEGNDEYVRFQEDIARRRSQIDRKNILFVVDASEGMRSYYTEVASQIKAVYDRQDEDEKQNLYFGFLAYGDGENKQAIVDSYQIQEFTSDLDKVIESASQIHVIDDETGDRHEPVLFALNHAMDNLFREEHQYHVNIIIHIGDCGDISAVTSRAMRDRDLVVDPVDLAEKMTKYRVNYNAIQARWSNRDPNPYYDFQSMAEELLESYANELYQNEIMASVYGSEDEIKYNPPQVVSETFKSYIEDEFDLCDGVLIKFDELSADGDGTKMPPLSVKKSVLKRVEKSGIKARSAIMGMTMLMNDTSKVGDLATDFENVRQEFKNAGFSDDQIEYYSKHRVQLYFDTYSVYQLNDAAHPMWKFVLFLSEEREADLNQALESLSRASLGSQDERIATLNEVFKTFVGAFLGMSEAQIMDSDETLDELKQRMLNLNRGTIEINSDLEFLGDLTLEQGFENLDDAQVSKIFERAVDLYDKWTEDRKNRYVFFPGGDTGRKYFWIDADFLLF